MTPFLWLLIVLMWYLVWFFIQDYKKRRARKEAFKALIQHLRRQGHDPVGYEDVNTGERLLSLAWCRRCGQRFYFPRSRDFNRNSCDEALQERLLKEITK